MPRNKRPYPEMARDRIRAGHVLGKLIKYLDGELEMTAGQIRVALSLLNKVVPDLKSVETVTEVTVREAVISAIPEMTMEEWKEKYSSGVPSRDHKPH